MNNIIKRKWNQNSMVIIEDLQGMAFQAESGGHTFQISGIDGEGNTVALSGTPAGVMLRSDGQDVTLTCSVSEGVVSATLPANAYSVPGRFGLTIFLTSDGQKTAIYAAVGTVGKTSSGTVAPPAGSDVVDLVNAIAAAVATIPASYTDLMASVAPTYSSSGLYAVGSYAWYNGKLYRCTTAITSGETWTSGHWTLANLGSDLVDLKSALFTTGTKKAANPDTCSVGAINPSSGDNTQSSIRLRNNHYITDDTIVGFASASGYEFAVFAWDKTNGDYIGTVSKNGGYSKVSSNMLYMKEFIISNTAYKYKIMLRNAIDTSATIQESEWANSLFIVRNIDKTLTQEGQAADAKATGDAIEVVRDEFEEADSAIMSLIVKTIQNPDDCVVGAFLPSSGDNTSSDTRLRSVHYISDETILKLMSETGYEFAVFAWNKTTGAYVGVWNGETYVRTSSFEWVTNFKVTNKSYKYKIMLRNAVDPTATMEESEWSNSLIAYKTFYSEDEVDDVVVKSYIDYGNADIQENKVCTNGTTLGNNNNFNTLNFYPIKADDVSYRFYINTRCYISEYSGTTTSTLIKVTSYPNNSIIKFNSNTRYVRISYYKNGLPNNTFLLIPVKNDNERVLEELLNNVYVMPKTYAMANMMASANQMLNVEYTPIRPMPMTGVTGGYVDAGTPCKGLPYSSTRSVCKYIGQHVTFYTFLTALQNPRSVLYTRRIKYGTLGKTYYGVTCFTFVSYQHGSRLGYFDNELERHGDPDQYELVPPSDVEVGDSLFTTIGAGSMSHCATVYNLHKDELGRIESVTISEASPPNCFVYTVPYTVVDGIYIDGGNNQYAVHKLKNRIDRRTGLPDWGTYDRINFVKGYADEIPEALTYPDIMSEYGDKAAIEAGTDVVINVIDSTGYNSIEVYKDDVLIDTKTTLEDFTISDIAYGTYKFKLVGNSKTSESYLIAVDVHGTFDPDTKIITFSSANASPVFAASYGDWESAGEDAGVQYKIMRFNESELLAGSADVSGLLRANRNNIQIGFLTDYGVAMWWSNKLTDEWEYWTPPEET